MVGMTERGSDGDLQVSVMMPFWYDEFCASFSQWIQVNSTWKMYFLVEEQLKKFYVKRVKKLQIVKFLLIKIFQFWILVSIIEVAQAKYG